MKSVRIVFLRAIDVSLSTRKCIYQVKKCHLTPIVFRMRALLWPPSRTWTQQSTGVCVFRRPLKAFVVVVVVLLLFLSLAAVSLLAFATVPPLGLLLLLGGGAASRGRGPCTCVRCSRDTRTQIGG